MAQSWRLILGAHQGTQTMNFANDAFKKESVVMMAASEYRLGEQPLFLDETPQRFVGDAVVSVGGVAPYDGGVGFKLNVAFGQPLRVAVDVVLESDKPDDVVTYNGAP